MKEEITSVDPVGRQSSGFWRIGLGYALLWWFLLVWASLAPGSFWLTDNIEASPASQVMAVCAILTPFFIAFVVYFHLSQTKAHLTEVSPLQLSSSKTTNLYLNQVVACFLLTLIPLLSVYILFALMSWFGFLARDFVTPIILGRFVLFAFSLTLLTSTTSVGLALSNSRALHLIATAIAVSAVTLPFILSELVTGQRLETHVVKFVIGFGDSIALPIFLLLSSLLAGSFFSWLYRPRVTKQELR